MNRVASMFIISTADPALLVSNGANPRARLVHKAHLFPSLPFPSACSKVTLSGASVSLSVTVEVVLAAAAAAAAACGVAHLKRLSNAARIFPEPLYDVAATSVVGGSAVRWLFARKSSKCRQGFELMAAAAAVHKMLLQSKTVAREDRDSALSGP